MILTKQQKIDFEKAAKPLMKYLENTHHPHVTAIITGYKAEILEGSATIRSEDARNCIYCKELVHKNATLCYYCKSHLD